LTWQVLEGCDSIPVTLFEASERVDSGPIYLQGQIQLHGDELVDELRYLQAQMTFNLCREFVNNFPSILENARTQKGDSTYYPRRTQKDSQLDPDRSIRSQFNLLRVVDNHRYPAWFNIFQTSYTLTIRKKDVHDRNNK